MIHILALEDDAKLNQLVCTYLSDCGFKAKGCLSAKEASTMRCITISGAYL